MRARLLLPGVCLAVAARAAAAQEPVLLQLRPPVGQSTGYASDVATWVRSPLLAQADTTQPGVRIRMHERRAVIASDSASYTFRDVTDSSSFEIPALAGSMPWLAAAGDMLRGMVTETVVRSGRDAATTRVVSAPPVPPQLPALLRGVVGLAVAGTRLATFAFPAHPVAPGAAWTDTLRYELSRDPAATGEAARGTGIGIVRFRFERLERRDGHAVAIVVATTGGEAAAQEVGASATMTFTGTARLELDLDAALVTRTELDVEGTMVTRSGRIPLRMRLVQTAD